ncbi:FMN-dependent dehydrogenase-domain-containing protein [Phellopilus nigrolimitatus]|nr:FMN-dependent dehydrogenase-domain-containing protein [Phellopilus nigrolimitatus]
MLFISRLPFRALRTRPRADWTANFKRFKGANASPEKNVFVLPHLRRTRTVLSIVAISSGVIIFGMASLFGLNPARLDSSNEFPPPSPDAPKAIPFSEVQKHNTRGSCWVIIDGQVYDATSIVDTHPGGTAVLLKNAGKDATKAFIPIHPPGTLSSLPPDAHIGPVDPATLPKEATEQSDEEKRIARARASLPPPEAALNLQDIVKFAEQVLTSTAWAYYRSAGDDNYTFYENSAVFKRFWFRPRVLNKVSQISTATSIIGQHCSLPIFIAPAALARLGHRDGEMNFVRAAASEQIAMGMSINASCSIDEVMSARAHNDQPVFFQIYMNRNRTASEALIKRVETEGFKAIILTVDSAVPGKRELDQRAKGDFSVNQFGPSNGKSQNGSGLGVAHAISGYQDPDVCWDDIPWIQGLTKLPIIIKGIQCVEDAEKAFNFGVHGIIISNHGGRSLDFAPAPMTVLYELHQQRPDIIKNNEVYIDGGITRGSDVLKALCLGARGVGLGRAFLYANGAWGEAGVRRVVQIMREEIETGMRLLGVTSIDQLNPNLVRYVDRPPTSRL